MSCFILLLLNLKKNKNNKGRRASDGGSNISLFQIYSLKNAYLNNSITNNKPNFNNNYINNNASNNNINNNTNCNSNSNLNNNNNNNSNTEENNYNTNEDTEQISIHQPPINIYQSRGSITSGIPIFHSASSNSNINTTTLAVSNTGTVLTSQSSEDEDVLINNNSGINDGCSSNTSMKYQRKASRSRHEPYVTDIGSSNNNLSVNSINSTIQPYNRVRPREQSFSGTNSSPVSQNFSERYNNRCHRGSEPNQVDLIFANRSHLERIYNQSINKIKLPINKELQLLQQENSTTSSLTNTPSSSTATINVSDQPKIKRPHQHIMQNYSNVSLLLVILS